MKAIKLLLLKGCNFYGFCGALSGYVNISTLVLISIDRCSVIMKPFEVFNYQKSKIYGKKIK